MRTPEEILSDVCSAFGVTVDIYHQFTNGKRPPDHISLITMAFVYIMLNTQCMNMTDVARILNKRPATISTANAKVCGLLNTNTTYSRAFKSKLVECCPEAKELSINQK